MEKTLVKAFFDACRYARHITDMVLTLPEGIHSHHIYTIEALHSFPSKDGASIADVASYLSVSHKTAGEYLRDLYHKGLVKKAETAPPPKAAASRRCTRVLLTEKGEEYHTQYVEKYYESILRLFGSINNNDMSITIRTIKQAHYIIMKGIHERLQTSQSDKEPSRQ